MTEHIGVLQRVVDEVVAAAAAAVGSEGSFKGPRVDALAGMPVMEQS